MVKCGVCDGLSLFDHADLKIALYGAEIRRYCRNTDKLGCEVFFQSFKAGNRHLFGIKCDSFLVRISSEGIVDTLVKQNHLDIILKLMRLLFKFSSLKIA